MEIVWMLLGGLLAVLVWKYWCLPIVAFFWLLGWNDRRRAKGYKSGGYTANIEFCKSCLSAKPKNYPCLTLGCVKVRAERPDDWANIDRIGAATNRTHFNADDEDGF